MTDTLDFGLISDDKKVINVVEEFCNNFKYDLEIWSNENVFMDALEKENRESRFVLVSAINCQQKERQEVTQRVQVAKQINPRSYLACVVGKKMSREDASFIIKSGANVILMEDELTTTSKLEYICSHVIKDEFIPIKMTDLERDQELLFSVYYYVLQRNKFIICGHEGLLLSEDKYNKMKKYGEFYIKRDDLEKFYSYMKSANSGGGNSSMEKRCRFHYLNLCWHYSEFVCLVTDYGQYNSFKGGRMLIVKCRELSQTLITSMAAVEDLWQVINQKMVDGIALNHVPAMTAYAGLFALKMGWENVEDIMLAMMLGDLSLVFLPPKISNKMKKEGLTKLDNDELGEYKKHPAESLRIALDRKLPISQKVRDLIADAHERANGSGFPRGKSGAKISQEAFLLSFVEDYHLQSMLRPGELPINIKDFNTKIFDDPTILDKYRPTFVNEIKKIICN